MYENNKNQIKRVHVPLWESSQFAQVTPSSLYDPIAISAERIYQIPGAEAVDVYRYTGITPVAGTSTVINTTTSTDKTTWMKHVFVNDFIPENTEVLEYKIGYYIIAASTIFVSAVPNNTVYLKWNMSKNIRTVDYMDVFTNASLDQDNTGFSFGDLSNLAAQTSTQYLTSSFSGVNQYCNGERLLDVLIAANLQAGVGGVITLYFSPLRITYKW